MLGSSLILNCDPPSESKKRSSSLIQTFSVTHKSYAELSRNTLEERIVYKYTSPVVQPYEMEQLAATKVMLGQKTLSQLSILKKEIQSSQIDLLTKSIVKMRNRSSS